MKVSHEPGSLKKLGRTPWRFQRTFETPLRELVAFVTTIFSTHPEMSDAFIAVESVVFTPKHPPSGAAGEAWRTLSSGSIVAVDSAASARSLLVAALSDALDFFFVPAPKPFVIYADHDEYCTFHANTRSNLNRVCDALLRAGFREVEGYERKS